MLVNGLNDLVGVFCGKVICWNVMGDYVFGFNYCLVVNCYVRVYDNIVFQLYIIFDVDWFGIFFFIVLGFCVQWVSGCVQLYIGGVYDLVVNVYWCYIQYYVVEIEKDLFVGIDVIVVVIVEWWFNLEVRLIVGQQLLQNFLMFFFFVIFGFVQGFE